MSGSGTLALRAMQAEITKPQSVGPVTEAIRAMRAADPAFDANPGVRALRRLLSERIESDMAFLDALDGDADLEPSLGARETGDSSPQWLVRGGRFGSFDDQTDWSAGANDDTEQDAGDDAELDAGDQAEEENEHGTEIDDGEAGDDNGISDRAGMAEQARRFIAKGGDMNFVSAWFL